MINFSNAISLLSHPTEVGKRLKKSKTRSERGV